MEMRWLFSTTGDINNETSRCWNFDPLQSFVQTCYLFFMVAFWKITKIEGRQYLPFLFSSLAHSKVYFPLNTPATNVEISTAIATIMTKSLRRDLGERLAAVNRSLLPLIESCSPRFASSRWIWSKEIASFSDDARAWMQDLLHSQVVENKSRTKVGSAYFCYLLAHMTACQGS